MTTRREFLKEAGTGAVALGAMDWLWPGPRIACAHRTEIESGDCTRSLSARLDGKLDAKRVAALLDRAIATYTGHKRAVDAWKRIIEEVAQKTKSSV